MDQDSAHMVAASKVPMLKPGVTTTMPITTVKEKTQRRLEDAKQLLEADKKRFGGNAATKKTQRNLLKQQYENFTASRSEMLDQTFDRLQKLVSQLELLGEKLSQEDVNQKLLRSLSPEWNTHVVVWRNKADLDTMSMDDLYNNLKSDQAKEGPNYARMAFTSSSSDSKVSNDSTCLKSCLETVKLLKSQNEQLLKDLKKSELMVLGNFMPPTPDLSFTGLYEFVNKLVVEKSKAKSSEEETKIVRKNDYAPIIENGYLMMRKRMRLNPKMKRKRIARTHQQNGVVERRNRTLIEAARTMLADSKLPTTFWTEAVNTACYVQNKVLVVKPYNKTPYELFQGKFDGKDDKDFFVGYSLNSKAFRVFISRTRILEENLHIRFSETTSNVVGSGPDWLFNIDALTRIINYEPIVAGTQSNGFVDLKRSHDDGSKPSSDDGKKVDEDPRKENECKDQEKEDNVNNTNNVNT
nr:retrovirus-related Pol polyprotein from transposon TNT 1-94 [Tanacetum cinerariifolium]